MRLDPRLGSVTTTLVNVLWNRAGPESNRCTNWSVRRSPIPPPPSSLLLSRAPFGIPRSFASQHSALSTSNSRGNKNLIGRFLCSPLRIERPPLEAGRESPWLRKERQNDTHSGIELTSSRSGRCSWRPGGCSSRLTRDLFVLELSCSLSLSDCYSPIVTIQNQRPLRSYGENKATRPK